MAEQVRVVVDAMGGDNAPAEPVRAAVEAVTERQDIKVILTGKQEVIDKELAKYSGYPKNQLQVVNASQVIETAEPPVFAIRKKKDSSIVVGLNMVKKQEADVRAVLKKNGFKWAPSQGAWQRMLNPAGKYALNRVKEELEAV